MNTVRSLVLAISVLLIIILASGQRGTAEAITELPITIPGSSVKILMKLISAGSFMMGSTSSDTDKESDEVLHKVTISEPFFLGVFEVTQSQWKAVMGSNPSYFKNNSNNPVENVSWNDCQKFLTKINTMGIGKFRLPTEAEWEYACRAGSTTRFPWGNDPNYSQLRQYAWYDGNSNGTSHSVGQKKPNAWGLYDMHGNVWEWCSDFYGDYSSGNQTDPRGATSGSYRVMRSGGWDNFAEQLRSAYRSGDKPTFADVDLGFRLVRVNK